MAEALSWRKSLAMNAKHRFHYITNQDADFAEETFITALAHSLIQYLDSNDRRIPSDAVKTLIPARSEGLFYDTGRPDSLVISEDHRKRIRQSRWLALN
ncbi:hypothetical protein RhiJN_09143 [Ceratobasidium sp. AG-Ba]|nr:hypothetical protein RhiJN_09143 [Ceratobasidium sp. AG-Ba]